MTEFQLELKETLAKFCKDKMEPYLEEDDHNENFRMDIFNALGELGITGMTTGEEFGGMDLSTSDFCVALTEIAKSSASYAVTTSVSLMVQTIIEKFGNDSQKKKYLADLTSGKEIGAFALSESSSGSDAASLKLTAKKEGDNYRLNGSKLWITSGGIAKTYVVMARTGGEGVDGISAFILEDGTPGFKYGKKEKKMGWKVSPTRELIFENCLISKDQLIGEEGKGLSYALSGLNKGRVTIASIAVGVAQRALDEAVRYSLERKQFDQPIFDFQGLQFMMADMATEIEASRALVTAAANAEDTKPNRMLASMAKLKATETAMKVTTDAVQILGGVGYTSEYPVERYMRDAKVLQIVEGTNQIQKVVISRNLKKKYS